MALELEELTGFVIGAASRVHQTLGPGFLESVQENALAIELRRQAIPRARQVPVPVLCGGVDVGLHRLDVLIADLVVVERKAIREILPEHFAVIRSCLRAVARRQGLLPNFSKPPIEAKRVIADGRT